MCNVCKKYSFFILISYLTFVSVFADSTYLKKSDKSLSNYLIGVVYSSSGDCASAIPYLEEAIEEYKDPAIYVELANCYVYSNSVEKSLELLEESIKLFPDYRKSYELAGDIYYQMYISGVASTDDMEKAVNYLDIACDNGKYPHACIKAVDISVQLKNLGTATKIFEKMNINEIRDPRFLAFAASMYQSTDNPNQLKRIIKALSRMEVRDAKLINLLINLSINNSMYNEAKIFLDSLISMKGDSFKSWDKYMFVLLETDGFHLVKKIFNDRYKNNPTILSLYTLANCYSKEHNYSNSIKYYQKVFTVDKGSWDDGIMRDIYGDYLKILIISGKYKKALDEVEKYRTLHPNDNTMLIDYFNVYAFNGKKKKALSVIKQLRDIVKNKKIADNLEEMYTKDLSFFKARYLGNVYFSLKDLKAARPYLEKAFKKDNSAKEVGIPLASLYEQLNLENKVLSVYSKLMEIHIDSADILNNYSYSLLVYGEKLEYALDLAKKAVSKESDNPVYKDTLGYAYLLTGDLEKGEKELLSAYSKIADNSEVCNHLGDLYFKKGDLKSAIKYWQEAVINGIKNAEEIKKKILSAQDLF